MEVFVIIRMTVEGREREELVEDLASFRAVLGRRPYLQQILSAVLTARHQVLFTTYSMEPSWANDGQAAIVEAVRERLRQTAPFLHRGIIASRAEALPGTFELLYEYHLALQSRQQGNITDNQPASDDTHTEDVQDTSSSKTQQLIAPHLELRMSVALSQTRLRFVTRDNEQCILGLSEGDLQLSGLKRTTLSFSVFSSMLGDALRCKFNSIWEVAVDPWDFLDKFIEESRQSHQIYSQDDVLRELRGADGVSDIRFRDFLKGSSQQFRNLPKD